MAVHRVELSCETCGRKTPHRFEYPSQEDENAAICEVCETVRDISIEIRDQLPAGITVGFIPVSWPVLLTTTETVAGHAIVETIDIVSAECVLGMNVFGDLAASLRDLVGGRSKALQDSLRQAKQICLQELRGEAVRVNANAVVGVSLSYSEISGGAKSMLFLVATGTAVRVIAASQDSA
jgi:uncharacterized protein YbjQ (UPF0145 family)